MRITACIILLVIGSAGPISTAEASLVINFANNDSFEGDDAGGIAGPFTDLMSGVSGTITTLAVSPSGSLNPNAGTLGINSGSGSVGRFDSGESWTFALNVISSLEGIDFSNFSATTESFRLTSPAFVGLSLVPGNSNINFDDSIGEFTFASADSFDDFNLQDLSGGVQLSVPAGSTLQLGFSGASGDNATLQGLTLAFSAIPEPTAALFGSLLAVGLGMTVARRRQSQD